ncbi:hypothetical protein NC653_013128 [Populus alba x Populus x berolinensis]|uniref:Uncharacterized protein n=1 Tax=Populus alba x Populus x berolinensis TaxID=444605 RepID=A0AAD6W248_9ROSI|nr:hypothetical protein NC653_013128 [Populus alba x Populus x berolinensis]
MFTRVPTKALLLGGNQSNVLTRELGRLNELRRLDIVEFRKRAGRALCSSIEMLINLRPLSVSAIRKGELCKGKSFVLTGL